MTQPIEFVGIVLAQGCVWEEPVGTRMAREQRKRERDLLEEAERDTHALALEVRTQRFMLQSLATCLFTASVSPPEKPWEGG